MFDKVLFWCEFPDRVNWQKLNSLLKKYSCEIKTYVAVRSVNEYKKLKNYSNIKIVGAWPTLPLKEGYWFSGHISKKSIDTLNQYKDIDIKLDLESPIPLSKGVSFKVGLKVLKDMLTKGKTNEYLKKKILQHNKSLILSTYPFPKFILKKVGFFDSKKINYNFFYYSSFIPSFLRPMYKLYFKRIIKKRNPQKTFFTLGLIGTGIFNNEQIYKNIKQFKKDVNFFYKNKVKNLVLFELSGILKRKNPDQWINYIKTLSNK